MLLVVSDHGFLWSEGRPPRPDSLATATAGLWHRQEGIYLLWGRGIEPRGGARRRPRRPGRGHHPRAAGPAARGRASRSPRWPGVAESDRTRDYGPRAATAPRPPADGAAAAREALEKLRALGYLGRGRVRHAPRGRRGPDAHRGLVQQRGAPAAGGGPARPRRGAAFEQALRIEPRAASAAHNLSVLLTDRERGRAADALLLSALANGLGDGARIVASAALTYAHEGDPQRARRLLDGAVQRVPEDPLLRYHRGRVRLEARDCAGALDDFAQAPRRCAPVPAVAHGLAGTALLCLGRAAEARAAFERSLELDPSQARLREQLARLR